MAFERGQRRHQIETAFVLVRESRLQRQAVTGSGRQALHRGAARDDTLQRKDFWHMNVEFTIDDPKACTRPWNAAVDVALVPDTQLMEFICLENERDRA
jgi:hypothetical protein